jgi:phosphoribosylamine-glycine ligase
MQHPRNSSGEILMRVLMVGAGPAEVAAAKVLSESGRVRGLYYCPDVADGNSPAMDALELTQSCRVAAGGMEEDVVRFCAWAFVDVVFVGPERGNCIGKDTEAALAAGGVTLFSHDISGAIADGSLSVTECFATLSEELAASAPSAEQLVE